jgi:hypothetical protein
MSLPDTRNIIPNNLSRKGVINLLLASIALEEMGLAHIINAEGEKIQFVLGTLEDQETKPHPSLRDLLKVNRSVEKTLRNVIKKEMLLQFKLEKVIELIETEDNEDHEDHEFEDLIEKE